MAQQTTAGAVRTGTTPALGGIRIMVLSAEAELRERVTLALRGSGAEILTAPPGAEAVDACQAFRPQLIVAARVPYAECARLIQTLREAGVAGTAIAVSPAADAPSDEDVDPRLGKRFEEELTGLLIRLLEGSRDSP
jgi:CheY-like chemotaxis protein